VGARDLEQLAELSTLRSLAITSAIYPTKHWSLLRLLTGLTAFSAEWPGAPTCGRERLLARALGRLPALAVLGVRLVRNSRFFARLPGPLPALRVLELEVMDDCNDCNDASCTAESQARELAAALPALDRLVLYGGEPAWALAPRIVRALGGGGSWLAPGRFEWVRAGGK
jgi:hypothetical protein